MEEKASVVPEEVMKKRLAERHKERTRDRRLDFIVKTTGWIVFVVLISLASAYGYFEYQQSQLTPVDVGAKNLLDLIRKNPQNAELRVRLGEYYLNKEDYEDARQLFKEALRIDPSNQRALIGLGLIYFEKHQNNQAYEEFMKIIRINEGAQYNKLNPVVEQAHYYAGLVLMRQKKYEKAVGHFRQAVDLNPNSSDTHAQLGKAFIELKMFDRAISEFDKALKVDPEFAPAHYGLGVAYEQTNQSQKAIEEYKKTLKSAPEFKEAQEALYRLTGM